MRWTLKPQPNQTVVDNLSADLEIDKVLATLLVQRGITTFEEAKQFFRPSLRNLHDPFLMKDMDKAVARIEQALSNDEKILIYGDYDVDGTTAVSLVVSYLKTVHDKVATYIPDRYKEGYGISYAGIDFAAENNFSLIIALDCGIKAVNKIAYASKKQIDFIICDHHKPGAVLPFAVAVLNPKRPDCQYPYKELCGCGVGFKLIQALASRKGTSIEKLVPYLDLVATAIAADIVPITGENRILTYFGLRVINSNPRNGLKALIHQLKKEQLTITDVVFIIAPRINAAGRMEHGNCAVALLTETDFESALKIASSIETLNSSRREIDAQITKEALQQIEDNQEAACYTTVVYNEHWHKGVIGIVASRLIETYYRPTLVFTKNGTQLAASARSVKGFNVYHAIEQCSEFIEQFGGHAYAAGLTILPENFQHFKNKFEQVVKNSIPDELRTPEITIDAVLELNSITPKFYRILQQMGPFGPKNMKPVFLTKKVTDTGYAKQVGTDQSHLKLSIFQHAKDVCYNAIGFDLGHKINQCNSPFDIAYSLDINQWNGNTSLQLVLKDLK